MSRDLPSDPISPSTPLTLLIGRVMTALLCAAIDFTTRFIFLVWYILIMPALQQKLERLAFPKKALNLCQFIACFVDMFPSNLTPEQDSWSEYILTLRAFKANILQLNIKSGLSCHSYPEVGPPLQVRYVSIYCRFPTVFALFDVFGECSNLKLSQAQRLTPRQRRSELRLRVSEGLMAQRFVCTPARCSMKLSMDMHGATVYSNDSSMLEDSSK